MPLNLQDKMKVVAEVASVAAKAHSAFAAEYSGLTVSELTELRAKARNSGVYLRVVKNTLARRAVEGTDFQCMQSTFTGPLILGFSQEDPGAAARLARDYSKDNEKLKVKFLSVGGRLLGAEEINRLASLPTREQAVSMLMAVIKAPIEKLVRVLAEPHAKLARTLRAVQNQKQTEA